MANLSLNYLNRFFRWPADLTDLLWEDANFPSMYRHLSLEKKREFLPQFFERNIDYIIDQLQDPDNDPGKASRDLAYLIIQKFDNRIARDFEQYGYGFKDYVSDNPDHFTRVMRKLYNAVLDDPAHNSIAVVKLFGNLANSDMEVPFRVNRNNRLLVRHDLYEQIVDDEMLSKAFRADFNAFYRELEEKPQRQFQGNGFDLWFSLDNYFQNKTQIIRSADMESGSKSSQISDIERQNLQEGLNRVIDLVKRRITEETLSQSESFPGVLEDAIKLRYFESSDLYNPPVSQNSAAILGEILNRLLSTMEQLQDDSPFRNFLANVMDFDGFFRAAEFSEPGIHSFMRRIVENSDYFLNSSRKDLQSYRDHAYLLRRIFLVHTFIEDESSQFKDMNAESVFSILNIPPIVKRKKFSFMAGVQTVSNKRRELYLILLKTRVRRWFEAFDDAPSRRERLVLMFQKIFQEVGEFRNDDTKVFKGLQTDDEIAVLKFLQTIDSRITQFDFYFSYMQFVGKSAIPDDGHEFGISLDTAYHFMATGVDNLEDINDLSNQEKLKLIHYRLHSSETPEPSRDFFLDRLFEIRDTDPEIQAIFDDEDLPGNLFYESSKKKIRHLPTRSKIQDSRY